MNVPFERKITLGFSAAVVVLLLIAATAWWNAVRYATTLRRVDHTHEVLDQLERALMDALSMQTSVRGFVLTGSEDALAPYLEDSRHFDLARKRLGELVGDNPQQQQRLPRFDAAIGQARTIMADRVAARHARGLESVGETAAFLAGQASVQQFRAVVNEMRDEEQRLLEDRLARVREVGRLTILTIVGVVVVAGFSMLLGGSLLRRDFIRRVRAEESLHATEERFRLLMNSVQDYAIITLDPEGRIASWNDGAHRIQGFTAAEILGQPFARFYPREATAAGFPEQALTRAVAEQRFEDEGWRVRPDGTRFWANVVITPAHDAASRLVGFVKITRDLTAQQEAEAKIAALNEDLRKRAEQLEAANRELEAFSYSVSHDLRAPLRHIDGFSNLLSNRAGRVLDEESRRFLAVISRSARQMGTLIDDLLALSRIGRTPLRIARVGHRQLVDDVIADGHYETATRPIAWEIGPLPDVEADAAMLRQVWQNLIDNAVKYSGKAAAPRIELGGRRDEAAQEHVFFVRDNGIGFDMQYADKLFGVFQRLHGPAEFEGTGIGLANVRRIVTRHGGRTWAESQPGAGATFYFSLPVTPPSPLPV